jgi:hypothetical protein
MTTWTASRLTDSEAGVGAPDQRRGNDNGIATAAATRTGRYHRHRCGCRQRSFPSGPGSDGGFGQRQVDHSARAATRARLAVSGGRRPPPPSERRENAFGPTARRCHRLPWLLAIARWIDDRLAAGEPGIITCSNLKRAYRRITVGERRGVTLVYLKGEEPVIHDRIARRQHRYMPPALLRSQFESSKSLARTNTRWSSPYNAPWPRPSRICCGDWRRLIAANEAVRWAGVQALRYLLNQSSVCCQASLAAASS